MIQVMTESSSVPVVRHSQRERNSIGIEKKCIDLSSTTIALNATKVSGPNLCSTSILKVRAASNALQNAKNKILSRTLLPVALNTSNRLVT
jgi:hypothetical protein